MVLVPLHGLGGSQDLPLPFPLVVAGAVSALVASFVVLAVAWRRPRYVEGRPERPVPSWLARLVDSPGWAWTLRLLGLAFFGFLVWPLVWGPDLVTNPVLGTFYVLVWVGLVPASLLAGRVVRAVSPVRTLNLLLARVLRSDPAVGVAAYPTAWGCWPAAVGLYLFAWQELVNPGSAYLGSVRVWLAVYVAVMLVGAAVFGDEWLSRADPFEAWSDLVARLSPWGRDEHGALVVRSPLANLATTVPRPGLLAVVAVMFGSTAFDSFSDTLWWQRARLAVPVPEVPLDTLALLGFCVVVGVSFTVAARLTRVPDRSRLPLLLAHAVVPIVVGYLVAHYLTYFVEQGQTTLFQLSDPLVRGENLFGMAAWSENYWLSFHPTLLAWIKVLAIVAGHVTGAIASHDRVVGLLPARHQVSGQLAMLLVMVAYTATGLSLLMAS